MTRTWNVARGTALAVALVLAAGTHAARKPPGGGGGTGCPKDIACLDVWDPVQCADGVIYSNQCYADRACAPKPCVSVEGGPVEASANIRRGGATPTAAPAPDCGPNFTWDCTLPDGSHQLVDATRCEIAAFKRQTGATCVIARG
jgi:hypothetical protein